MGIGKKEVVVLAVLSMAGVLSFALLRSMDKAPSPRIRPLEVSEFPASPELAPSEPARTETKVEPAPEPGEGQALDPVAASTPPEPVEPNWRAVQRVLEDEAFVAARAKPADVATGELKSLVARARSAVDALVSAETDARVAAGLGRNLPGYVHGQEFIPPKRDKSLFGIYAFVDGQALQVDLTREEYPELYALSDGMQALEEELEARERAK